MATYTFNPAMADTVRDEMARVTKLLKTELENMDQQVRLTLADWDDAAKRSYDQAQREWTAAANRMPHSLHAAEVALSEITSGYLKVEHTGMNAWGGFSVK
ncbi:WXG100 family type VII secretion target [Lentzea sp.]|uniref:WXG100 family type VII secretion target n=1 Tax=Lentzea sp. TaxID=56099 RepID=UPI002ED3BE61